MGLFLYVYAETLKPVVTCQGQGATLHFSEKPDLTMTKQHYLRKFVNYAKLL